MGDDRYDVAGAGGKTDDPEEKAAPIGRAPNFHDTGACDGRREHRPGAAYRVHIIVLKAPCVPAGVASTVADPRHGSARRAVDGRQNFSKFAAVGVGEGSCPLPAVYPLPARP